MPPSPLPAAAGETWTTEEEEESAVGRREIPVGVFAVASIDDDDGPCPAPLSPPVRPLLAAGAISWEPHRSQRPQQFEPTQHPESSKSYN